MPASLEVPYPKMPVPPTGIIPSAQDFLKSVPELRTEDGVNDRVQCGVKIPQPKKQGYNVTFE